MAEDTQVAFNHQFTAELRERLDAYLEAENERIAPGKLSLRSVVNQAVREFLDRRDRNHTAPQKEVA